MPTAPPIRLVKNDRGQFSLSVYSPDSREGIIVLDDLENSDVWNAWAKKQWGSPGQRSVENGRNSKRKSSK